MDPKILCGECHAARDVLEGKGATGLNDVRSFHSAVTCGSCHMPEANHNMKIVRPDTPDLPKDSLDTCSRCHKDKTRDALARQLQDWRELYRKTMDPIDADLKMISAVMKEKPDLLDAGLQARLSATRANLFLLTRDSARDAHNLDFALEIARQASKLIEEIKEVIKRELPPR
jgi:formate-dependent nitrite reductase cytochrome c552 subunit